MWNERIFAKKILLTSKIAKKYKINSILFVFYLDIYATTVKISHLLTKQHIKYINI